METILLCAGAISVGYCGFRIFSYLALRKQIQRKVDIKGKEILDAEWNLQTHLIKYEDKKLWEDILEKDFEILQEDLQSGKIKSVEVLRAYQWKALKVNNSLNAIVNFLSEAESWAEQRDELSPNERGPLHGIPISVKECYKIQGCDSTAGCAQFLLDPARKDCLTVTLLKKLGAVPFCQTNVPQTMYAYQCSNIAYGATGNPFNPDLDVGGSSGGEAAIIGAGASILGVGSDVGGSLRCPAALCGIYSLKPTFGRHLSQNSCRGPVSDEAPGIRVVGGFMARSTSALISAYKAAWEVRMTSDQYLIPLTWRENIFASKKVHLHETLSRYVVVN